MNCRPARHTLRCGKVDSVENGLYPIKTSTFVSYVAPFNLGLEWKRNQITAVTHLNGVLCTSSSSQEI